MIAITDADLVVGRGTGIAGPVIPPELLDKPDGDLRLSAGQIVALDNALRDYWIDHAGQKHIAAGDGWQKLRCRHADVLIRDSVAWRVKSPADALAEAKARARGAMIAFADGITERITGQYPAAEVASWPTQEAEARAVIAGADASAAPLISALAAGAKMAVADYAKSVLAKAAAYRLVVTGVKSLRDSADVAIAAAGTPEAVGEAVANLRQSAETMATALGLTA